MQLKKTRRRLNKDDILNNYYKSKADGLGKDGDQGLKPKTKIEDRKRLISLCFLGNIKCFWVFLMWSLWRGRQNLENMENQKCFVLLFRSSVSVSARTATFIMYTQIKIKHV